MTVRRLERECDSPELTEWYQHFQEEPWPWERGDAQAAIVAATVHNASGNYRTGASVEDYLLRFGHDRRSPGAENTADWKGYFAVLRERKKKQ